MSSPEARWRLVRTTTPTYSSTSSSGTWEWASPACCTSSQRKNVRFLFLPIVDKFFLGPSCRSKCFLLVRVQHYVMLIFGLHFIRFITVLLFQLWRTVPTPSALNSAPELSRYLFTSQSNVFYGAKSQPKPVFAWIRS